MGALSMELRSRQSRHYHQQQQPTANAAVLRQPYFVQPLPINVQSIMPLSTRRRYRGISYDYYLNEQEDLYQAPSDDDDAEEDDDDEDSEGNSYTALEVIRPPQHLLRHKSTSFGRYRQSDKRTHNVELVPCFKMQTAQPRLQHKQHLLQQQQQQSRYRSPSLPILRTQQQQQQQPIKQQQQQQQATAQQQQQLQQQHSKFECNLNNTSFQVNILPYTTSVVAQMPKHRLNNNNNSNNNNHNNGATSNNGNHANSNNHSNNIGCQEEDTSGYLSDSPKKSTYARNLVQ